METESAACNRAHHVNERCARWLLMTHDQAASDHFPITHEFLAQTLGACRKLRYIRVLKNQFWMTMEAVAYNLLRMANRQARPA